VSSSTCYAPDESLEETSERRDTSRVRGSSDMEVFTSVADVSLACASTAGELATAAGGGRDQGRGIYRGSQHLVPRLSGDRERVG
jgi:hypothetical protein